MVKVIMHGCNGKMGQVITGIIAEYNPFHNGHAYQIAKIKEETDSDYVMSP